MTLEEIKKIAEYGLPFQRIDPHSKSLQVLDCLLSNYELPQTADEIQSFTSLDSEDVQEALNVLLGENIILLKKEDDESVYLANFRSPKTTGLFQYYRAVLDENLSNLEYNKVDLK